MSGSKFVVLSFQARVYGRSSNDFIIGGFKVLSRADKLSYDWVSELFTFVANCLSLIFRSATFPFKCD